MDSEFLVLALVFVVLGVAGIALFNGPLTPSGDSCYCIIPSPEPGAAQGTSSILLVLGFLFVPIGLMRGGPPSFGRRMPAAPQPAQMPGVKAYPPLGIRSGGLFSLGVAAIIVGVDMLLLPGYLLFSSLPIAGAGAGLTALGVFAVYRGTKKSV